MHSVGTICPILVDIFTSCVKLNALRGSLVSFTELNILVFISSLLIHLLDFVPVLRLRVRHEMIVK
jgi:hypothetical protein